MYVKLVRQKSIFIVGLFLVGCIVVSINLFPVHSRLLPGYETLHQTDQASSAIDAGYSIEEIFGNKTPLNKCGFPASGDFCGGTKQWLDYAQFHHNVLTGKENGKYLKYTCSKLRCGGFGNRIQGITMGLIMSMLTKRVFILEFYHPFDFSKFLLPNFINWKSEILSHRKGKYFDLMNTDRVTKDWTNLETLLLDPNADDTIEFATNVGIEVFMKRFSDTMLKKYLGMNISTFHNYNTLYGCVMRFLFKHNSVITDSILREQKSLDLKTGHYVAVHIRTGMGENLPDLNLPSSEYWIPYLECAVTTAKEYAEKYCFRASCPVYVLTDVEEVKEYAISHYGDYIKTSTVYTQHIDHLKVHIPQLVEDTFVGLLTDIEMAARAAIFISTKHSSFSNLIEGIGFHTSRTTFSIDHCS